jgi:Prealbumin-like fold domain
LRGSITYTPNSGYTGSDSFSFRAFDTRLAASNVATISITVGSISPPPPPPPTPAHLTVIKHVINDNGGTNAAKDFTISVSGTNVSPQGSFPGAESPGTTVTLNPGTFSVSETGPSGYTQSLSGDCSGTISSSESKTCTITNNDKPQTGGASITIRSVSCGGSPTQPQVNVDILVSGISHDSHSLTFLVEAVSPSGNLVSSRSVTVQATDPDPAGIFMGVSYISTPDTPAGTYKIIATPNGEIISTTFEAPDCLLSSANTS